MKVSFAIEGEPKGKGRPRVPKSGYAYTPEDTVMYENLVKVEYKRQCGRVFFDKDSACDCGERDLLIANHPDTNWKTCVEHAEKLGLGTRNYELIKI